MFHLVKQELVVSFVICFLLGTTEVFACGCGGAPGQTLEDLVEAAVKESRMVFAGKVVGFEYRKGIPNECVQSKGVDYETKVVKFQVERWWKGEAPKEIFLATDETRNVHGTSSDSSCNYDFQEGQSYLVFAYGKENELLRTGVCSRTKPLPNAGKDLEILREGKEPVEEDDGSN